MVIAFVSDTRSSVNTAWKWQTWQDLPYLTCNLLSQWSHGFFTRSFYPRSPEELTSILTSEAEVYRVKQVHGNCVLTPKEIKTGMQRESLEDNFPNADGIITEQTLQAIWVASADCTPLLMGDVKTGRVSAIHAGWRGTAQRIAPEAISRFLAMGSRLEDLRVAMGPAINGTVYQVTKTVAICIGESLVTDNPDKILTILENMPNSPVLSDAHPDRVRIDVRLVNLIQLLQLGLQEEQIAIAPYCTYQQPDYFFSFRRTQEKKVQWSGIISV
ncbi:peptidoglycan editing factor PgeF [Aphanothece hegewaldii CCALA 016]|uniref:Purine nucleoside phosphorylase n=1 Tax=Aphanothece hegewaldii CCALA 016 TaxID=2107694 RepID=A0A2T1M0Z3_9CHRO|nr:peptidoglycan editing factor PgeF [Aphanothece hegewaldii]PSF38334.1 peptidoglycan editing factor PgeF [Aphanothece hegewaldii CCALA 016]